MDDKKRKQFPIAVIMILVTAFVVIGIFGALDRLYRFGPEETEDPIVNENTEEAKEATDSELVILHKDASATVKLFDMLLELPEHTWQQDDTVDSQLLVTKLSTGEKIAEIQFSAVGERKAQGDYFFTLANATPSSMQVVVSLNPAQ